jgi:hypothetical protein
MRQLLAYPFLLGSLLAPAICQTRGSAGGPLTIEDFQTFNVANGTAMVLDCPVLDSTAICNNQGPGLVVEGVGFTFNESGQWDGAGYYGAPSKEILSNTSPLTISFEPAVTIFDVNMRAYTGYPATATVTVYGPDDTTVIGTLSNVYLGSAGVALRVGWQDDTGIGKVVLAQTGQFFSPIIDDLEFGAATATLTLSPGSAVPGTPIAIAGSGFAANENIQVVWQHGSTSKVLATLTADAGGAAAGTTNLPLTAYGTNLVYALGESSGLFGAALLSVTPRMSTVPNAGVPGTRAVAQGSGFGAREMVQIYWASPLQLLGTAIANADGTFTGATALGFTIPAGAAPGENLIYGIGESTQAEGKGFISVQ